MGDVAGPLESCWNPSSLRTFRPSIEATTMTTTTDASSNASAKSAPAALEGDHWIEPLRDGTRVLVRPLRLEDRAM